MIIGVGVDTVKVERIRKSCQREYFVNRIYTAEEQKQFDKVWMRASSDYAAKEAVAKMLGTGFTDFEPGDIEILRNEAGAPYVNLYKGAQKKAEEIGITKIFISITNTDEEATAFVIGSDDVDQ